MERVEVEPTNEPSAVFIHEGKPFCFTGTNNYYLSYKSPDMAHDVLAQAQSMGLNVVRTWAFGDRGSLDGFVPSVDGNGTKEGVYFQYWDTTTGEPAYNDGPDGLERLDRVLAEASALGLKVILVLTDNWKDFGGMDQYVSWFGLRHHHEFYTEGRARRAYKNYVAHLLGRINTVTQVAYKDDPTIFAWELANQPRCGNAGRFDAVPACHPEMITAWAREMSEYIHSIDTNHLVAVGDEGFYRRPGAERWMYNGANGVDHEALLKLPGVDYGTFHLYPDPWGQPASWGNEWIEQHIESARRVGKPVVLAEYGVPVRQDGATRLASGFEDRAVAYENWNNLMMLRGGSAALFWLLVGIDPASREGYYEDYDHFSIYNREADEIAQLLSSFAGDFPTKARACELAAEAGVGGTPNAFVSVTNVELPEPAPAEPAAPDAAEPPPAEQPEAPAEPDPVAGGDPRPPTPEEP